MLKPATNVLLPVPLLLLAPAADFKTLTQDHIAFRRGSRPRPGIVLQHCCHQHGSNITPIIENMAIDIFVSGACVGGVHLVKKQVSQTIMDESSVHKFHRLWSVGLA